MKNTKLMEARNRMGFTQEEVSEMVGISTRAYKTYESGERIPRADTAKQIAKILKSTVEKLF